MTSPQPLPPEDVLLTLDDAIAAIEPTLMPFTLGQLQLVRQWLVARSEGVPVDGLRAALRKTLEQHGIPLAKWLPSGQAGHLSTDDYGWLVDSIIAALTAAGVTPRAGQPASGLRRPVQQLRPG